MRPDKWSERSWVDAFEGWQFRTFKSPRMIQVCLSIDNYQGDGVFHLSVHLRNKALALEFPFNASNLNFHQYQWKLVK